MRPRFFIGACLFFWGISTNLLVIGIIAAVIIEFSFIIPKRRTFSINDYTTLADISSTLVVMTMVLMLITYEREYIMINFIKWLPIALLPVMIGQFYGDIDTIIIGTRLGVKKGKTPYMHKPLNITPYYTLICIISAAIINLRSDYFYPSVFVLTAWGLFSFRSKRAGSIKYSVALLVTLLLGLGLYIGYSTVHRIMWNSFSNYLRHHYQYSHSHGNLTETSIGDIGKIKLDDSIVFRVSSTDIPPFYIRKASYSLFRGSSWYLPNLTKQDIFINNGIWNIIPIDASFPTKQLSVQMSMASTKNEYLLLPPGSHTIKRLAVVGLFRDDYGTVKIEESPSFLDYSVDYSPALPFQGAPRQEDLLIPPKERELFNRVAREQGISNSKTAAEAVDNVKHYFSKDFYYSLTLPSHAQGMSPLGTFLTIRKAGHCEFFATATVLLLRTAGVPARYVTGYYVYEYSTLERQYIARARHAHAWVTAYVDGKWVDIDTTPSIWLQDEEEKASGFLSPLRDLISYLRNQYLLLSRNKSTTLNIYLAIIAALLSAFLIIRIYRKAKNRNKLTINKKEFTRVDSLFYAVENKLTTLGFPRPYHMTFQEWLHQINDKGLVPDIEEINNLLEYHYRLRFDPIGLTNSELEVFSQLAEIWLNSFNK